MENFTQAQTILIPIDSMKLEGNLVMPQKTKGIVLFAHGSGSNRFSPGNAFVAEVLQKRGIGTFLFDLLTIQEDEFYKTRFNINLLFIESSCRFSCNLV